MHPRWSSQTYGKAWERSLSKVEAHGVVLACERAQAPALFEELMRQPACGRESLLAGDPRFRTWGLFELLIERSQEIEGGGEELGLLALRLSDSLDSEVYNAELIEDLRGRAWAYIGNARRLRSNLRGADEAFEKADACLRLGTQDLLERAIFLDLKASLLRAQRRFEEAMKLSRRALSISRRLGQQDLEGRNLVESGVGSQSYSSNRRC